MEDIMVKAGRKKRMNRVSAILDKVNASESLVINDYRGLSVDDISRIRRELAPVGATLHIEKNKLVKIALGQAGYSEEVNSYIVGPTAVAYVNGDISAVLKVLFKYSKDATLTFEVKGAYVDGVVLTKEATEQVSKLPTRDELIAQLMATMNAPLTNLTIGMNDVIVRVARVLQAYADTKE